MKKNIAIVGGSSDIAIATVNHISNEEYNFFALVRGQEKPSELSDLGVDVTMGDATSEEDIKNFIASVKESGEIHGVLHCVGSFAVRPPHAMNKEAFESVISTNLTSAFLTLSIAGKAMLSQAHGRMVFMSSVAGSLGLVNHEAISAAKGGVESMVRSAAATYANRGLRINAVAPGLTDTKLASPIMSNETASQAASQKIPIKRVNEKEEIAEVLKWLLTESPDNFTGQILHTDGGMSNVLV
ncbi:SDR family oxidoreductase [Marine Group III euryarchaeote]|nr:SDR family oxidoreductase [Marine Group III euryarchaeote]